MDPYASFARNDGMAGTLKVPRRVKNPTPSVDACLLEIQLCQISIRSDLRRSLRLIEDGRPQKKKKRRWRRRRSRSRRIRGEENEE